MEENVLSGDLKKWVEEIQKLTQPDAVHVVDGSREEEKELYRLLVQNGTFVPLNPEKRPNSYLAWSNPDDVARVEDRTFICTEKKIDAGPTNNWLSPKECKERVVPLFAGCMRGRTMYVVPYCMGPIGSPYARIGVEITDSPYVVVNLLIMTRIGEEVLKAACSLPYVKCVHSVGVPLLTGQKDVSWPCNPKDTIIAHFPETMEVWSYGSGYGGNALLSKKCHALRLASWMAKDQGWLAEHMLILGVTNPEGKKRYIAASFPSQCGKTNLAMIESKLPGWKAECVGDDIAWMFWNDAGELRAVNPEFGCFGVAPGTSVKTNKNAIGTLQKNCIFTNVGVTKDGDVWWEGLTDTAPEGLTTWRGEPYVSGSGKPAAHPNARFTAPISQCPSLDSAWNDPHGVPISAIIFGGRRESIVPLVREASSWRQGVFDGAAMTSETTAAAKGVVGKVRHDPFAMLPFCGYNMGDYFGHWLSMEKPGRHLPGIFYVNWFLKDSQGKFVWPGFWENMRVLAWIFNRLEGKAKAVQTPVGLIPDEASLDLPKGTDYTELFPFDREAWKREMEDLAQYFASFGERLPAGMALELAAITNAVQK
jgi:phosphoenolpyruvate carboxykinase (GTP)